MTITCTVALRTLTKGGWIIRERKNVHGEDGDGLYDLLVDFALNQNPADAVWNVAAWKGANANFFLTPDLVLDPQAVNRAASSPSYVRRSGRRHHRPRLSGPVGDVVELIPAADVRPGTAILVTFDRSATKAPVGNGPWPAVDSYKAQRAVVKRKACTENRQGEVTGVDLVTTLGEVRGLKPLTGLRPAA